MAKNLVNGTNIIIEESGDNISMNLSSAYNTNLQQEINDSFKENNIYSTNETVIGTWINSKPIYRKVIDIGNLPNSSSKSISIGYSSGDITIIKLGGIAVYSNGISLPVPNVSEVGLEDIKLIVNSNNEVVITTYNDRTSAIGYVIIEYTKTTDV